jgi:adenylate cyclase class IV
MIEVELKSVVDDVALRCRAVEAAGGRLVFAGRLEDRRYDTGDRALTAKDIVLRLRTYRTADTVTAALDWKGPTHYENGYKLRDELTTAVGDPVEMGHLLERLGYEVTQAIDRTIAQYALDGTTVRFETYPRMDDLVEVEGEPAGIEAAIAVCGLPRGGFTSERLQDFALRFQERTGTEAALCDRALRHAASPAGDVT